MKSFLGRDILSLREFERDDYYRIFEVCDMLAPHARNRRNTDLCADKTLLTAFYQPSTRTRMATEAAMHRMGGHVLGFSDAKMTRAGDFYQESIKDTVHMLEYYADVIAMRHFQQGAPAEAARYSSVPIINCGDGWGEHPTQVLTDLYTMLKELGRLDGLRILCVGDMRMRTMHSIGYAATQFDIDLDLVYPPEMAPTQEYLAELDGRNTRVNLFKSVHDCVDKADVIYMEPVVQADYTKARVDAADAKKGLTPPEYQITTEVLKKKAKRGVIVIHSLPRMDELTMDVDSTRHARYWIEAFNGVVLRMALIALVLGKVE
ncbi:MAG: aspartate carbamoyltransferase [Candidatus Riflebacteria bacterium]|nr:aspartate carbamoyltransferase [Candidatus Riflebacteria bacterium]